MTTTLAPPTSKPPLYRRRPVWIAAVVTVLVLGGAGVASLLGGDDDSGETVVRMGTVEHTVVYEIAGTGPAPLITYLVGENNKTAEVRNVPLPWRQEISLPVGPAGNFAQVEVKSAQSGVGSLACRIYVDGKLEQQQSASDGYAGVACASRIAPEYVK